MKKRDQRELERYVRHIANEVGLRDWTLQVHTPKRIKRANRTPDGNEWGAICEPVPGRKCATLTFADARRNDRLEDLRQTVVHELVHCHFYGLWDTLDLIDSQQTYDTLIAGVERHMEYGVDAVAEAIAPRMPLIDWPS